MKKLLALVLAALLCATCLVAFASCKKKGDADGEDAADAPVVKVINVALTEEEYAFAVAKGNDDLLAQLNAYLTKIQGNGTFTAIVNKYFGDGTPTAVTSAATKKTDGTQLIVATNAAFAPFEYKEGVNYYGIDMEIMAGFAAEIGKELYIDNMNFDAVCLSVSASGGTYEDENGATQTVAGGLCDVAAAGLTVNEKRKETLDFSASYYNASQMLIVKADNTEFDACTTAAQIEDLLKAKTTSTKVGAQSGTTGFFYCKGDEDWGFDGFPFTTVGYTTGALAVQDILNGNLNYVIIDEGPAKAIVANVNAAN